MPYIGQPLNAGNLAVQTGTGDGSDTTPIAALNYSVGSSESLAIYLDGVKQAVSTYTAIGTVLTFTTAPPNLVGLEVVFLALSISLPTPGDNTVDETKLKDALIADFTEVVVTASDSILLGDATDSGNTKRDTVQGILDLAAPIFANSSVHLHTSNGYGSTNNKIRRFSTTITNAGSDITYADSAADGAKFTINTAGVYAIAYADEFGAASRLGISLNSSQLTTGIDSITAADALVMCIVTAADWEQCVAITLPLAATDIIRPHCNGAASGSGTAQVRFAITRVA